MDSCCIVCIPTGERVPLFHCDHTGCANRADYKTSCSHHFCYRHVIKMGKEDVPEGLRWKCLKETCESFVNPNHFTLNHNGQVRTHKQITDAIKAETRRWAVAGTIVGLIFVGAISFIASQE